MDVSFTGPVIGIREMKLLFTCFIIRVKELKIFFQVHWHLSQSLKPSYRGLSPGEVRKVPTNDEGTTTPRDRHHSASWCLEP